jgi:hypothetical protein
MMHGYVVEGSPEKHRGSPEVSVIPGRSRYFLFARARVSERTAAPRGTARLAESPLAYSVSEREAGDQADCNFQHSDKRAWAVTRTPPERIKRLKGGSLGTPVECHREVFYEVRLGNAARAAGFLSGLLG